MSAITVGIPTLNGGRLLEDTLDALARQTLAHELLVCDSGSSDRSVAVARAHGARLIEIPHASFNHGATRNLIIGEAQGEHVALLSQDAEPADARWLERLMGGFDLAGDVALVFGPYRPRPESSPAVRLELDRWFASLSSDGAPRVERLAAHERGLPARELVGRRGFFTDANAAIARRAWEQVPFRAIAYAEDRALAMDMLRAGYAKAFVPEAAVIHSHDYTPAQQLRRCFDEWRGLLEVYGWREPAGPLQVTRRLAGELRRARDELPGMQPESAAGAATLAAVGRHHVARLAGAMLGSHADRLPAGLRRVLSLEGRATFVPMTPQQDRT